MAQIFKDLHNSLIEDNFFISLNDLALFSSLSWQLKEQMKHIFSGSFFFMVSEC